jgi:very-short-patch-repair endonuclease
LARSTDIARRLRRSETEAEQRLWLQLRDRRLNGWKFRRQAPLGGYYAGFLCVDARLVVELDGSQHAEARFDYDQRRSKALQGLGYRVLRIWNNDVLQDIDAVLEAILAACERPSP